MPARESRRPRRAGVMAFRGPVLRAAREDRERQRQGRVLPDRRVLIANRCGGGLVIEGDADEVAASIRAPSSPTPRASSSAARAIRRWPGRHLIAPRTVWFSHDTRLAARSRSSRSGLRPGVTVADNVTIRATGTSRATIASGAGVGPFAACARRQHRGERPDRRFRRGEERAHRRRRQGQSSRLSRRCPIGAATNIGAGTITATTTASTSSTPRSGRTSPSGRMRCWWPRSRSAMAPASRRAALSAAMLHRMHWPWRAGQQVDKPEWARKFRDRKLAERAAKKKK